MGVFQDNLLVVQCLSSSKETFELDSPVCEPRLMGPLHDNQKSPIRRTEKRMTIDISKIFLLLD